MGRAVSPVAHRGVHCVHRDFGDTKEAMTDFVESFTNLEVAMRLGLAIRTDAGRGGYDECTGSERAVAPAR